MRKLLWMIIFLCAYIWFMQSGRDQMALEKGKALYKAVVAWLDDAEVDFHIKKEKPKKRSRRWD